MWTLSHTSFIPWRAMLSLQGFYYPSASWFKCYLFSLPTHYHAWGRMCMNFSHILSLYIIMHTRWAFLSLYISLSLYILSLSLYITSVPDNRWTDFSCPEFLGSLLLLALLFRAFCLFLVLAFRLCKLPPPKNLTCPESVYYIYIRAILALSFIVQATGAVSLLSLFWYCHL